MQRVGSSASMHNLYENGAAANNYSATQLLELERVGIMAAYDDWDKAVNSFDELLTHYSNSTQNESSLYTRFNNNFTNNSMKNSSTDSSPEKENNYYNESPDVNNDKCGGNFKSIAPVCMMQQHQQRAGVQMQNESMEADFTNIARHNRQVGLAYILIKFKDWYT